jgi:heme/copper-type cytochrome/quinol oxidase subunit 4
MQESPNLLRRGVAVFIGLALLTGLEFWVAVGGLTASLPLLLIVALAKTVLILEYFMHVRHIFDSGEGGHG